MSALAAYRLDRRLEAVRKHTPRFKRRAVVFTARVLLKVAFDEGVKTMEENIKRRISVEPRYEKALYRILGDCLDPIAFSDLERKIGSYPEMQVRFHEPATLVSWLVDAGALEALEVEPGGDEANRSEGDIALATSEAGKQIWAEHETTDDMARLIGTAGSLARAYKRVLELCRTPQSKRTVERALSEEGLLDTKQRQASCFLDKLEKAGGLVWNKGWTTTRQGLSQLD